MWETRVWHSIIPSPSSSSPCVRRPSATFAGTLRRVAEMGYEACRVCRIRWRFRRRYEELLRGDRTAGRRVARSLSELQEDLRAQIDYCAAIGCPYLVLASLPGRSVAMREGSRRSRRFFDTIGLRCRERESRFGYHNHDFDFAR